ncbi:MAG: ribulose-phosphate 3-epimerase [Terriglobia bacterium]
MALIAPALLAADFARLGEALDAIERAGATMVHVDVMDGHFTSRITVGQPVVKSLRQRTRLSFDVHLLIERPERYAAQFVEAGADRLAVHPESTTQLHRVLELIRARGAKVGVALNPATTVGSVADVLCEVDFLTILCADAGADLGQPPTRCGDEQSTREAQGFSAAHDAGDVQGYGSAQSYGQPKVEPTAATPIPASLRKIRAAARARQEQGLGFAIVAEGGVTFESWRELAGAGADILVAGSAIFHTDNPKACLTELIRLEAGTGS